RSTSKSTCSPATSSACSTAALPRSAYPAPGARPSASDLFEVGFPFRRSERSMTTRDTEHRSPFDSVEDIIDAVRRGEMVVILDDEDRENEGDLVMAATKVRPEDINFMARYGRGLICLTLTRARCEQLRLPLMVNRTDERRTTNFTVSIEAAEGVTTGISAHDRARTIRAAVAPNARPEDLVQPGHIFPLMAQPGGVLTRAGHTEAGC